MLRQLSSQRWFYHLLSMLNPTLGSLFIGPITSRDIVQINLEDEPASHVAGWLDYVGERLSKEEIAKLDFLPDLITHDDQSVRQEAIILAAYGRNLPALKVFVDSPFSQAQNREDKSKIEYEYWRHIALLESCAYSPDASLVKRMSPEHIALIAKRRPADTKVLSKFNEYLKGEFEAINIRKLLEFFPLFLQLQRCHLCTGRLQLGRSTAMVGAVDRKHGH